MKRNIRKEFVDEIKNTLPKTTNAAMYLADELKLGRETVYRRLRGTVPFSLDEAVVVAQDLDISLDRLAGVTRSGRSAFEFSINYSGDFKENYDLFALGTLDVIRRVAQDPSGILISAANILPWPCYGSRIALATFRYKRWLYERGEIGSLNTEALDGMPYDYVKAQNDLMDAYRRMGGIYMIWDSNVFSSLVKEIKYFRMLNMITDGDVRDMRRELFEILDWIEKVMNEGRTASGVRVYIYLSNINFDASYSYMESRDFQSSIFHIFGVHQIESSSREICTLQKSWLQNILKHSTLITLSGEIERTAYLKAQRETVETL